ncbi:NAD-dependent epimerase/dehydratase family protein [uncultured Polaribacter sp.]|uniref:NAD-dependent epimerase/dehydratase family protein n=1 Tax=uncultured Polaribacter sp. TaxID=174711 RepID=UPI00262AE5D9|nr:NAD-dependent epimerase/dehydratase family protein [uncultured Polaribacter sp.]
MNLLITGSNGFIGINLINRLSLLNKFNVFYLSRYNDIIYPYIPDKLDYVIHLASVHRVTPEKLIVNENIKINTHLIETLKKFNLKSNMLFTSSIHEKKDTFYGESKRHSSDYLKNICEEWETEYVKLVFPNIFGPFAKPYHTSVVANFCNDIILEKKSIINNVDFELIYINKAINAILQFRNNVNFNTQKIHLLKLHEKIYNLYHQYISNKSLIIKSSFDFELLTTLKSYMND